MAGYNYYKGVQTGGFYPTEEVAQSKINAAWLKIQMLDQLWHTISRQWRGGQLIEMHITLMNVWVELEADATEAERKDYYERELKIMQTIVLYKQQKKKIIWGTLSTKLQEQWMRLKRIEKTQGLGKAYKEEEDEIF
jgi:hypothetical protein